MSNKLVLFHRNFCRQYGGGGHPGAAGFAVPAELPLTDLWAIREIQPCQ